MVGFLCSHDVPRATVSHGSYMHVPCRDLLTDTSRPGSMSVFSGELASVLHSIRREAVEISLTQSVAGMLQCLNDAPF